MNASPPPATSPPRSWRDSLGARLADPDARRASASWAAAGTLHAVVLLGALLVIQPAQRPAPEPPRALDVQIVMLAPPDAPAPEAGAEAEDAEIPEAPASAAPAPPSELAVVLPDRSWPDVLRLLEDSRRGASAAAPVAPGLPAGVRAALATAHYCRSTALGIAAERRPCPPALDQFALAARVAAFGPNHFFDPATLEAAAAAGLMLGAVEVEAQRPIAGATGPTSGRDRRLSSSDEMGGRLPPKYLDPAFGD
jgi:hypothetical protein